MVEELRAIFQILGDTTLQLGEYALWAGGGFIFYKLATLASYLVLAKYAISLYFGYLNNRLTKEKEVGQKIHTGDMVVHDGENLIVCKTFKQGDDLMLMVSSYKWTSKEHIAKYCRTIRASECELIC